MDARSLATLPTGDRTAFHWKDWTLWSVIAVSLLWRAPSLFDPPWVNDEGTYFAIAQALNHGYRLYADIWENKPPGVYVLYTAVYHWFGPSLVGVRLLAAAAVAGIVLLAALIADLYLPRRAALFAAMLAGLLFGVPFIEGTTANAEVFMSLCTAGGVCLALARHRRPVLAGLAMGLAVLFKAVGIFDAIALALLLSTTDWRATARFSAGFACPLAICASVTALTGSLGPMVNDAVWYAFGYVGHGNGGGVPWLLVAKLTVLVALTVPARRGPFPFLWLLYAGAGALVSGRFFGHYALQAVVPLSIVAVVLSERGVTLGKRALVALGVTFLAVGAVTAVAGWSLAATGHDGILARRLQYYANFARWTLGTESYATYQAEIDDHVTRNLAVVDALRRLPPGKLLVWGNTPWLYPLSGRLPATAYTSSLRQPEVPGESGALRQAVQRGRPVVLVVINPPLPPLGVAVRAVAARYRSVRHIGNATVYRSVR